MNDGATQRRAARRKRRDEARGRRRAGGESGARLGCVRHGVLGLAGAGSGADWKWKRKPRSNGQLAEIDKIAHVEMASKT